MGRLILTDAELLRALRSAGISFYVLKIEDMVGRTSELEDNLLKNKLVKEYFETQSGFTDSKSSGTRVRVNSTYRIIRANGVEKALDMVISKSASDSPYIEKVKDIKRKIENGELRIPKYE